MQIVPKRYKRKVNLLTDPQPRYVSLVNHGANQTPFLAVKKAPSPNTPVEVKKMQITKRVKSLKKAAERGITVKRLLEDATVLKIVFSGDKATEDFANKWLTDKAWSGYSDFALENDALVVKSESVTEDALASVRAVEVENGVTVMVGVLKAEDGAAVATTKTQTAPRSEIAIKYDAWSAWYSGEGNVAGVIAAGTAYDGVPPGVDDVLVALRCAIANCMQNPQSGAAGVSLAVTDAASLINGLYSLFLSQAAAPVNENMSAFVAKMLAFMGEYGDKPEVSEDIVASEVEEVSLSDELSKKLDSLEASMQMLASIVADIKKGAPLDEEGEPIVLSSKTLDDVEPVKTAEEIQEDSETAEVKKFNAKMRSNLLGASVIR